MRPVNAITLQFESAPGLALDPPENRHVVVSYQ